MSFFRNDRLKLLGRPEPVGHAYIQSYAEVHYYTGLRRPVWRRESRQGDRGRDKYSDVSKVIGIEREKSILTVDYGERCTVHFSKYVCIHGAKGRLGSPEDHSQSGWKGCRASMDAGGNGFESRPIPAQERPPAYEVTIRQDHILRS